MNSKNIGNIGEAHVLAALTDLNISTYLQFGDNEVADYLIMVKDKILKVQVKASTSYNGARTIFNLTSSHYLGCNKKSQYKYTKADVDCFLCYDIKTKNIFVFQNNGNCSKVSIRYKMPKIKVKRKINYYKDFLLSREMIENITTV